MSQVILLLFAVVGIAAGSRVKHRAHEKQFEPFTPEESLANFKEEEDIFTAEDKNASRKRTEIRKLIVYKVQPVTFPFLANSNAADLIGELTFLANDMQVRDLKKSGEIIVEHEVEIKVASNPSRAYNHYLRYIGGKPDKDPKVYGIDTVGWKMREHRGEGWLSFPGHLKCSSSQNFSDGCAWKDLRRVKSIHSACLMELIDDGPRGSNRSFEEVLQRFNAPSVTQGSFLDFNQKLAIKLFERAFEECPDAGVLEFISKTHATRRCCCFNGKHPSKRPQWVQEGVCLPGASPKKVFGGMWSMDLLGNNSRCLSGHSMYKVDTSRGRCLTVHPPEQSDYTAPLIVSGDTLYNGSHAFKDVNPTLVKSNLQVLGADLWKENNAFVCPADDLGLHHNGCDCSWAREEC